MSNTIRRFSGALIVVCSLSLATMAGCSKDIAGTVSTATPIVLVAGPAAEGGMPGAKGAFTASCARCHGDGSGKKGSAPDLSHFGANPTHTPEWIAEYISNPQSKNPSSKMPAFQGRIHDDIIKLIASYVSSLK